MRADGIRVNPGPRSCCTWPPSWSAATSSPSGGRRLQPGRDGRHRRHPGGPPAEVDDPTQALGLHLGGERARAAAGLEPDHEQLPGALRPGSWLRRAARRRWARGWSSSDDVEVAEDELPEAWSCCSRRSCCPTASAPVPGAPESHAAVVVRASAASPVRTTRAWRAGCSVTARTYPAGPPDADETADDRDDGTRRRAALAGSRHGHPRRPRRRHRGRRRLRAAAGRAAPGPRPARGDLRRRQRRGGRRGRQHAHRPGRGGSSRCPGGPRCRASAARGAGRRPARARPGRHGRPRLAQVGARARRAARGRAAARRPPRGGRR